MASTLKTRFRGLNTDLPATKLASGTAREALNVTLVDGKLAKRAGFGIYRASGSAVSSIWIADFKAGTQVIVKGGTARDGFGFMWANRFIYADSSGVTQKGPSGTFTAGLPQPTPINIQASEGGCKNGFYHCHFSYYNDELDVEGVVCGPCKTASGPAETRIADGNGGISFAEEVPAATGYEATHSRVYTSMGNTEVVQSGGILREDFSYRAALDVQLAIAAGAAGTPGMNKGDNVLDWTRTFTNEGGTPPAASIGCWNGAVAVYVSSAAGEELVYYSKFGRPTMVPQLVSYSQTAYGDDGKTWTDSKAVVPRGDHHVLPSPCGGAIVEAVAAGGTIVLFTASSTWAMRSSPDGKLYAVKRKDGFGCVNHFAATAFGHEVHAMAHQSWTVTTANTFEDISQNAWATTLAEIPAAQQSDAVMGAFHSKEQIWCAVTKDGATYPRRILVLDVSSGSRELMIYEPAETMWESSEYITALREYAPPNATPTMLIGTSTGRILQYPDQSFLAGDGPADDKVDFPATWRGVFGTERSAFSQKLEIAEIHAGDNCSNRVRWTVNPIRANGEASYAKSGYINTDNAINTLGLSDKPDARYWEVELNSPPVGSTGTPTAWSVYDIIMRLTRVGPT